MMSVILLWMMNQVSTSGTNASSSQGWRCSVSRSLNLTGTHSRDDRMWSIKGNFITNPFHALFTKAKLLQGNVKKRSTVPGIRFCFSLTVATPSYEKSLWGKIFTDGRTTPWFWCFMQHQITRSKHILFQMALSQDQRVLLANFFSMLISKSAWSNTPKQHNFSNFRRVV